MITIVLPISRTEYLRPVFNCLDQLERPDDTEIIILTDGDESLQKAVDRRLDQISYTRIQIINFGDSPAENIDNRRYRISAIHNKAKNFISDKCHYVFSVEDDTVYPADTLTKMLELIPEAGYIEGVQMGRHKSHYIGAWEADDLNDPKVIQSLLPSDKIYEPITAGGLYCCLFLADLYRKHHFEPYDKQGKNGLSCDVNFGFFINKMGYQCYIDWSIQTDHIGDRGSVNLGNATPVKVIFEKRKDKWSARTVV